MSRSGRARRRYAVLEDQVLTLYKSKEEMIPSATVDMCAVIKVKFEKQPEMKTLGLVNATEGYFSVSTADKEYQLFADKDDNEDAHDWVGFRCPECALAASAEGR